MLTCTYFPKVRRMLLFHAPLIWTHFRPASTLLRGHLALATVSPLETDPQILERWGYADEVDLGKNISDRRILISNFSVTCNGFPPCLGSSVRLTTTSAAPCDEIRNTIVVFSMICTQKVGDSTQNGCHALQSVATLDHDLCHGWQRVAPFDPAAHTFTKWLLHFCHHSFWTL